ncbi:hypothetical protein B5X24_HaOG204950 [Helicoverpa armigera]|nr:hypothetical protein B5X24_HaOG204950 [Helicoverpa armigera]
MNSKILNTIANAIDNREELKKRIENGNSLWSYTCLHLTKHEKERFKILTNINTPLGYFRAFLRAALNERSLDRYLQSWVAHGLLMEYYEEGALVRDPDTSQLLPSTAAARPIAHGVF